MLGRGGMGEVVVARHALLGERVAIKSLLAEATTDRETVERFLNEARASLRIRSEHVVRVSDVDLLPDGRPFMVMELLEGRDLEARMQEGAFGVEEAVDLLLQACEGVAEAHRIGIVHRDLKPGNMFLTRRSDGSTRVVLLDFGISKFVENAGQGFTSTTGLMGSPSYMSPEQFQNPRDVDARTDVWALGVILFRMLAGRAPFVAFSVPALVVQVLREEPPRLRSLRPDVPPLLEALVAQCLQKPREARVESVAALAKGLAAFASRDSSRAIERLQRFSAPQGAMAETRPVLQALPTASEPTAPRVLEPT
ncbi:MAG: serine/threonine protein kinase, partial [Sandaracinaceae bacterium]|nr:serine/threonine protein kinase [Sandaracinaceae bacterium]